MPASDAASHAPLFHVSAHGIVVPNTTVALVLDQLGDLDAG